MHDEQDRKRGNAWAGSFGWIWLMRLFPAIIYYVSRQANKKPLMPNAKLSPRAQRDTLPVL